VYEKSNIRFDATKCKRDLGDNSVRYGHNFSVHCPHKIGQHQ
jgi:hypothetical protein